MNFTQRFPARALALAALAALILVTNDAFAAKVVVFKTRTLPPRPGESVSYEPLNTHKLEQLGAEIIADYSDFLLIDVPEAELDLFLEEAVAQGFQVEAKPEYDRISMNGYVFPATGLPVLPSDLKIEDYPEPLGTYIVQLQGPTRGEWLAEVRSLARVIAYYPENTYLVAAPPTHVPKLRDLSGVQHVSVHQPAYKIAPRFLDEPFRVATIQLDGEQDLHVILDILEAFAGRRITTEAVLTRRNAWLTLTAKDARLLARFPEVLWIEEADTFEPSDERQALAIAGKYTSPTPGVVKPTPPAEGMSYKTWLLSKGFCEVSGQSGCIAHNTSVGILDGGLDSVRCTSTDPKCPGAAPAGFVNEIHRDFGVFGAPGLRVENFFCSPGGDGGLLCIVPGGAFYDYSDPCRHGTAVASVIAGEPDAGKLDNYEALTPPFLLGSGIAPQARLQIAKIFFGTGCNSYGTTDAAGSGSGFTYLYDRMTEQSAHVSNNSFNAATTSPKYTTSSQKFDVLVRDSSTVGELQPMAIVFSAGNVETAPVKDVLPPANAKNVITVGAAESYRLTDYSLWNTSDPQNDYYCSTAESLANIAKMSARGILENTTERRRFKPDLVAPATRVGAAWTRENPVDTRACTRRPGIDENNGYYSRFFATSAAAPVVTGAVALLDGWLLFHEENRASPALLKAVLVAHADDMQGGIDKVTCLSPQCQNPVPFSPSLAQGWGRVNLDNVFPDESGTPQPGTLPYVLFDEDHTPQRDRRFIFGPFSTSPSPPQWQACLEVVDRDKPVIIALAFTDAPSEVNAGNLKLNDLDVDVLVYNGFDEYFVGNRFDAATGFSESFGLPPPSTDITELNTVEVVRIPTAAFLPTGQRTKLVVTVRPKSIVAIAVPGFDSGNYIQDFAIYMVNVQSCLCNPFPGKGDLNEDGAVNAGDAVILANFLVGNLVQGAPPFTAELAVADFNNLGGVNSVDAVILANILVGNFPCE